MLKFVTTAACPHCECEEVVKEEIGISSYPYHQSREIRYHTNGTRWENRQFLCGYELQFVPNYKAEQERHPCTEIKEYRAREKRKDEIRRKIAMLQGELARKVGDTHKGVDRLEGELSLASELEHPMVADVIESLNDGLQ